MFEGFIPNLGVVKLAYPRDLSLEDGLGISHPRIIGLLLGLVLGALGLRLGPQSFVPSLFHNVFGILRLNQLLLKINNLLLSNSQLIFSFK